MAERTVAARDIAEAVGGREGEDLVRCWLSGGRREAVFTLYRTLSGREAGRDEVRTLYGERVHDSRDHEALQLFAELALRLDGEAAGST